MKINVNAAANSRLSTVIRRISQLSASCALLVTAAPYAGAASDLDAVFAAWEARQTKFRSFRFEWTSHGVLMPNGVMTPIILPGQKPSYRLGPAEETEYSKRHVLVVDGTKMLYSVDGGRFDSTTGAIRRRKIVTAFDGSIAKSLDAGGDDDPMYPAGTVFKEAYNHGRTSIDLKPLIWAFRGLDIRAGGRFRGWLTSTGQTLAVGNDQCLVLAESRHPSRHGETRGSCYACPEMEFVLLKTTLTKPPNQLAQAVEIDYSFDSGHGAWVPASWSITRWNPTGNLEGRTLSTVESYALNPTIPPETFTLDFPAGTVVTDMQAQKDYVVTNDGGRRNILRNESSATYKQWLATPSGGANPIPAASPWRWVAIAVNMLLILCAGGWLFFRHFRARGLT